MTRDAVDLFPQNNLSAGRASSMHLYHTGNDSSSQEADERSQRTLLRGRSSRQEVNLCPLGVLAALEPPLQHLRGHGSCRITGTHVCHHAGLQPALAPSGSDVLFYPFTLGLLEEIFTNDKCSQQHSKCMSLKTSLAQLDFWILKFKLGSQHVMIKVIVHVEKRVVSKPSSCL